MHGQVHAIIGNGGQSLQPFSLPGNTSCCCQGPGAVRCEAACAQLPPWSRWRFTDFGYSTIEIGSDASTAERRLTMSFFNDRRVNPAVQMANGTWLGPNELLFSFNITKRILRAH
jgi:hypothetical protein